MHTPLCKHAVGEPEDYAERALAEGLKGIIFTCHNPIPEGWAQQVRMSVAEFDTYVEIVNRAKAAYEGRLEILLGLESDFAPGMEPWLEELHGKADFHYILGSVHCHFAEYRERYFRSDLRAFQRQYFEHLAESAESGLFDCLAHPDLIRVVELNAWDADVLLDDIRRVLDRIAATGVAMELNTSGALKGGHEVHPCEPMLREMKAREIPIVIGSDAHQPERVSDYFMPALSQLMKVGYDKISAFRGRERYEVDLMDALRSLTAPPSDGSEIQ
jgi:histidinol-phosphatase (PHP family)|tara:strand:+ start:1479 stop:2297 length:819 start_codon:yes stop_codon:yes gene_type:complete